MDKILPLATTWMSNTPCMYKYIYNIYLYKYFNYIFYINIIYIIYINYKNTYYIYYINIYMGHLDFKTYIHECTVIE